MPSFPVARVSGSVGADDSFDCDLRIIPTGFFCTSECILKDGDSHDETTKKHSDSDIKKLNEITGEKSTKIPDEFNPGPSQGSSSCRMMGVATTAEASLWRIPLECLLER